MSKQILDSLEPEINNIFIVRRNEVNREKLSPMMSFLLVFPMTVAILAV